MSTSLALEVRDATVSFAGIHALSDLSFGVEPGQLLGLIGPNGAGKTTLVNVISGFQRPDRGEVLIGGVDVTRSSAEVRSRRGLARTFQGVRLFGRMTVGENIEVAALAAGSGRRQARTQAHDALETLGLTSQAERLADELPYGDQRRLAIARCLAMQPVIVLLDEPAAGLNEEETDELGDVIDAIRRDHGTAIVLVEHDVALVMRLSDRVLVLAEGRTLALGDPESIRHDPEVAAAYLGVPHAHG